MRFAAGVVAIGTGLVACGNVTIAQAIRSGDSAVRESRLDLFAGYSYFNPVTADINNFNFAHSINRGALFSATGYFNRYFGLQVEGSIHPGQNTPNECVYSGEAGPVVRYQLRRWIPYAHALGGGAKLGGPSLQPCSWGYGFTTGVGLDYVLPLANDHLAFRAVQADFNYNRVDFGPPVYPGTFAGGEQKMQAYGIATGFVYRMGDLSSSLAVALSCLASPSSVYPGDPVVITSNTIGLVPKRKTDYVWSSTGGKISGSGDSVRVATEALAPGSYVVSGRVVQGKKPIQQGTCSAEIVVKAYDPPAITCSATPSNIHQGEESIITSAGTSPQGRALTYSFSASAGKLESTGSSAHLTGPGPAPTSVAVNCVVVDDLGQTATDTINISVLPTEVPPSPVSRALCSLDFSRDVRRPVRVSNEAKACLDDIAITLQREPTSHLFVVGDNAAGETIGTARERANNSKLYLTREKGIDPGRITLLTGMSDERNVTNTLVPQGVSFDYTGTQPVDETTVKHHGQAYGPKRATHR